MTSSQTANEATSGKEQAPMVQSVLLLAFCLFMGLLSLAVCVWVALTGQLFTLDGLLLVAISLSVGGLFMGNLAWSIFTGEAKEILNNLRSSSKKE
jgi:uncharacterized YccA/Bax inhibitor family protein